MIRVDIVSLVLAAAAWGVLVLGRSAIDRLLVSVAQASWWKDAWSVYLEDLYLLLFLALVFFIGVSYNLADTRGRQILLHLMPTWGASVRNGASVVLDQTAVIIGAVGVIATIVYVRETRRMRVLQERLVEAQESAAATDSATMVRIADALERLAPSPTSPAPEAIPPVHPLVPHGTSPLVPPEQA